MSVIRVETDETVRRDECQTCGSTNWRVHGFVYADEEPNAVYYIDWCEGPHDPRQAFLTLSFGLWADDAATGADRLAFCVEARCDGMRLSDTPVRDRPDFLGRFVRRDEALGMAEIDHLWHVTDHVWTEDRRVAAVAAWLCGDLPSALGGEDRPPA